MKYVKVTNEGVFQREFEAEFPVYGIGVASRFDPGFSEFASDLEDLASSFRGMIPIRLVDLEENPSLVQRHHLTKPPTLLIFSFGAPFAQWRGRIDMSEARLVMEALLIAFKDIDMEPLIRKGDRMASPQPAQARSTPKTRSVNFLVKLEGAKEVRLTGDFTNWSKDGITLQKLGVDQWRVDLRLPEGQYHYRLIVDGVWQDHPQATKRAPNPFGSENCVLTVSWDRSAI